MENVIPEAEKSALMLSVKTAANEVLNSSVPKLIEDHFGGKESIEKIKSTIEAISSAKSLEEIATLKTNLDTLALDFKAAKEQGKANQEKSGSFAENIMRGVKAQWEGIKSLKQKQNGWEKMNVKVASTMTEGASIIPIGTNSIPFSITQWMPGYTPVVRRNPFILALCNVVRTADKYIAWAEMTSTDPGAAANTAEGAAKTQGSFTWTENHTTIEKMTYYVKISKEMLDDVNVIESAIREELMTVLQLRLDQQIFGGSGSTPQIKGLTQYAQAFVAPSSMAYSVDYASYYDVLHAAIVQIQTNGTNVGGEVQGIFNPTAIILNPIDFAQMISTKDKNGNYVRPPFVTPDGLNVLGVPITQNVGVTAGKFFVGDMTKATVAIREDATIAIGYENDDFTKNLSTILGEVRAGLVVKNNYVKAFVCDTLSTALSALKDAKS